jgi:hypothetical protein
MFNKCDRILKYNIILHNYTQLVLNNGLKNVSSFINRVRREIHYQFGSFVLSAISHTFSRFVISFNYLKFEYP